MSVKVGGEQHAWLHQQWPPPYCCLCNHEALLTTKDAQIGALEKELEWHRDADRQDYIRTGGRSSSKLLEEIAALEAEVKWLRQCRTCGGIPPSSGKVCICGGTNFVEEEIRHLRLELFAAQQDLAPFVALAQAAEQVLAYWGAGEMEHDYPRGQLKELRQALAHPTIQRAVA